MGKEAVKNELKKALEALGFKEEPFLVEIPNEKLHGDYSTSVALTLSRKLKKNPLEIAKSIALQIKQGKLFKKVEAVSPGFVNFYLSKDFFIEALKKIDKNFGRNNNFKNKTMVVEHTNVNPFKVFHIGHLNNNAAGESLFRIFKFHGAEVKSVTYQGDVGIHVARAIYAKQENPNVSWGDAYALGTKLEDEGGEEVKNKIEEINKKIYDRSDPKINSLYNEGKKWSLDEFNKIYKKLDTKFDRLFFESEVEKLGKEIVLKNIDKVFEKGEGGAIIFKGEKYGLHTRVFINSKGIPIYEAKELGLTKVKYDEYKYDKSIVVTGNEINEYFKVLLAALSQIFPELAGKTKHIGHGMMRLPDGKMSSRTGNVITADSLIEKTKEMILQKLMERDISQNEKDKIAEQIAIGAIKYSILKQSIGSDIVYDFEKSISLQGDSGPYLQYAYVRAQSVLQKARTEKIKGSFKRTPEAIGNLEKMLSYFPEVVEKAGEEYNPHYIALYLTELAHEFNNYYAKEKIVDKEDANSSYRIALTQTFSLVMSNGLWLLGIPIPEKM